MTFQEYLQSTFVDRTEYLVGYPDKGLFISGVAPKDSLEEAMIHRERMAGISPEKDWRIIMRSATITCKEVPTSKSQVDPV